MLFPAAGMPATSTATTGLPWAAAMTATLALAMLPEAAVMPTALEALLPTLVALPVAAATTALPALILATVGRLPLGRRTISGVGGTLGNFGAPAGFGGAAAVLV